MEIRDLVKAVWKGISPIRPTMETAMNQQSIFTYCIDRARDVPQGWGRFKTFVGEPGPRKPRVPLALAYALYTDVDYQQVDLREALRTARALGFEVQALMADQARAAEKRWGR
jgi:hypothetical protein